MPLTVKIPDQVGLVKLDSDHLEASAVMQEIDLNADAEANKQDFNAVSAQLHHVQVIKRQLQGRYFVLTSVDGVKFYRRFTRKVADRICSPSYS